MRIELEKVHEIRVIWEPEKNAGVLSINAGIDALIAVRLIKGMHHAHPEVKMGVSNRATIVITGEEGSIIYIDAPISPERADELCQQINRLAGWEH